MQRTPRILYGAVASQPSATGGRVRLGDLFFATDTGHVYQVRNLSGTLGWYSLTAGASFAKLLTLTATPGAGGSRTIDFTMALSLGIIAAAVPSALVELLVPVPATATATVTATTGTLLEAQQPGGGGGLLRILGITNASGALVIRVVASTGSGACVARATHADAIGTGSEGTPTVTTAYP